MPTIQELHERNKRVELDKAWEISKTRKWLVAVLTYITVVIFLVVIHAPLPLLNALIPTLGFLLSTLTLPYVKKIWKKHFYKK